MVKVTLPQIVDLGACDVQVMLFEHYFGDEVEVTPELIRKYRESFSLEWIGENLIPPEKVRIFQAENKRIYGATCGTDMPNCCEERRKQLTEVLITLWLNDSPKIDVTEADLKAVAAAIKAPGTIGS
jgi:hypothetical protein